jgi:cadmium resistance protein CadD (predicted permease)
MKTEVAALLAEMLLFGLVPIAFGIWQIREVNKERRKRQQEREQQGHQQGHHTDPTD